MARAAVVARASSFGNCLWVAQSLVRKAIALTANDLHPRSRSLWTASLLVALGALGLSCATSTRRGMETAVAKALISTEEENQLGLQLKNELDTK